MLDKLKSPVAITILLISFVILVSDYNFRWKEEKWKYALTSDGLDYYSYLTMVFVDHHYVGKNVLTGNPAPIKHYIGTALFLLPFFSIAYALSAVFSLPLDGVSVLFQVFVTLGTLVYLALGLIYLAKFLKYYKLSDWIICTVLAAVVFTTHVFFYTSIAPGWSHIPSFMLVSFLLYHSKTIYEHFNRNSLFFIITSASFLFWVRPTDVVIAVVIPFMAGSRPLFIETFKKAAGERKVIAIAVAVALIPAACQFIIYKIQTGSFITWSYKNEPFYFLKPEIANVLFSFSKGLFVYAPVTLLSLFGLLPLFRKHRFEFYGVALFTILNIYIIASWWCWNYGVTYGPRSFTASLPVFFLLLGLLLNQLQSIASRALIIAALIFFSIVICFQMYQSEKRILDTDYSTTAKGYWETFLKTGRGYSGRYYRFPVDSSPENIASSITYFNDLESIDASWINLNTISPGFAHSGKMASRVNKNSNFSTGIKKHINEIPYRRNVIIRLSGWFYIPPSTNSYFCICFKNDTSNLIFMPYSMDRYIKEYNHWEYLEFELYMPKLAIKKEDEARYYVITYLFNQSDSDCYVDDLKFEFTEYKKLEKVLDIAWE